jgi:hypothetical protein
VKEGARTVKDTAKGAWDYGTAKAGEVVFGGGKWSKDKQGDDDAYYSGGDNWGTYGYGQYGGWPDEDSYGYGKQDWTEWKDGKKDWEGDFYY